MTFRLRLALAAALAVALTVAAASAIVFVVMRAELRRNVDVGLRASALATAGDIAHRGQFALHDLAEQNGLMRGGPEKARDYIQFVGADGQTQLLPNELTPVPAGKDAQAVARGTKAAFFRDATVGGVHSRIYTAPVVAGLALQVVRPLTDVDRAMRRLELILLLVLGGGLAAGAAGGALVSHAALVPIRRLTATAERIAETGEPNERVPVGGHDELSRLGSAFNTMLVALEGSIEAQRRFVADASHELRTPLTSMQTNIEVLKQQDRLDAGGRRRLFADLERESHEMRDLIGGLLELARGDANRERTTVQLDDVVESAVERARSRFPGVEFQARLEPTAVEGIQERLERAVWNLLENAGKWSNGGGTVEVALAGGELRVCDHGPGIAPEDRDRIFDRFYRATSARSLPGSGLGLAIVREVAEEHGGSVVAEAAPGGGALLRLRLPNS
jgi:two-component system sensor histidine kinase MprB